MRTRTGKSTSLRGHFKLGWMDDRHTATPSPLFIEAGQQWLLSRPSRHRPEPMRYSQRVSIGGATQPQRSLTACAAAQGSLICIGPMLRQTLSDIYANIPCPPDATDVIPQGRASSARSPERGWTLVRLTAVSACGGPNQVSQHRADLEPNLMPHALLSTPRPLMA